MDGTRWPSAAVSRLVSLGVALVAAGVVALSTTMRWFTVEWNDAPAESFTGWSLWLHPKDHWFYISGTAFFGDYEAGFDSGLDAVAGPATALVLAGAMAVAAIGVVISATGRGRVASAVLGLTAAGASAAFAAFDLGAFEWLELGPGIWAWLAASLVAWLAWAHLVVATARGRDSVVDEARRRDLVTVPAIASLPLDGAAVVALVFGFMHERGYGTPAWSRVLGLATPTLLAALAAALGLLALAASVRTPDASVGVSLGGLGLLMGLGLLACTALLGGAL